MIAPWAGRYVGIPYAEADCWQLVRGIYHSYGLILPSYQTSYAEPAESAEIAELVAGEQGRSYWERVESGRELWLDLVLLLGLRKRLPSHIGLVVGDGAMLHTRRSTGSVIESYRSGFWAERVVGIYHHADVR